MNIESTFPEIVHTNVIRPQLILLVGFVLNNEFDQNLSSSVELAPIVGYAHFGGLRSGQYRRIAEIEFGAAYCTKADFTFAQSVRAKLKEKLLANRIVFQLYQR
jgi:hypothetical protein